jgi:hypothetical protein
MVLRKKSAFAAKHRIANSQEEDRPMLRKSQRFYHLSSYLTRLYRCSWEHIEDVEDEEHNNAKGYGFYHTMEQLCEVETRSFISDDGWGDGEGCQRCAFDDIEGDCYDDSNESRDIVEHSYKSTHTLEVKGEEHFTFELPPQIPQ